MRFDAVLFDLDGTLADTLEDIACAANAALTDLGQPTYETQDYVAFIGRGPLWLAQQALDTAHQHQAPQMAELIGVKYRQFGHPFTRPYDGIPDLLDHLTAANLTMAVLSNKPHAPAQNTIKEKFGRWSFATVQGQRDDVPLKPDPTAALRIADELGIPVDRWLYLGDSAVDMQTAGAAGMFAVGATWGFSDAPTLRDARADALADHPSQVAVLLADD